MSSQESAPTVMDRALQLIQDGATVQAEELVRDAVRAAEREFGPHSPQHASALNDLATALLYLREPRRAVEALHRACAVYAPDDHQACKDRLTYLMNLGYALQQGGDLDEAERVLRDGLDGRRLFYGRKHAGYGFGLEPLADLLLRRGRLDEALKLIDEAVDNFWANSHPRIATALALRAVILKALGSDGDPFEGLDPLPDDIIAELAEVLLGRVDYEHPSRAVRQAVSDLLPMLVKRFGEAHDLVLAGLQHVANLERHLGDHEARVDAIRRVIGICDGAERPDVALSATQGLALALSEAGQNDAAEAAYRDALVRAAAAGSAATRSQVLRNFGLFLAEQERRPEAEGLLREAVQAALLADDAEMLGRARVALGVFLQHGGDAEGAKAMLMEAVRGLDPAHPDAICARSHLDALLAGGSCGCGDQGKAVAEACREFILARVPQGLLSELKVENQDNDLAVQVFLDREPTPEELEQLERILRHGVETFRRRLREGLGPTAFPRDNEGATPE